METSPPAFTEFTRRTERGLMLLSVDLNACEALSRVDYPWLIWAVTSIQAPDQNGFPLLPEDELLRIETEELFLRIHRPEYLHLGHMRHEGRHVIVLHTRHDNLIGQAPSCRVETPRYTWDIYYRRDPDMDFVRGRLLPNQKERRRIRNAEVLDILRRANDNPDIPRPITFYGLFTSLDQLEEVTAKLAANGFRTTSPSELPASADANWSLMFQRIESTDPATIDSITALAQHLCEEAGGLFDGWECEAVQG